MCSYSVGAFNAKELAPLAADWGSVNLSFVDTTLATVLLKVNAGMRLISFPDLQTTLTSRPVREACLDCLQTVRVQLLVRHFNVRT